MRQWGSVGSGEKRITSSKVTYKKQGEFGQLDERNTIGGTMGINWSQKEYRQIIRYSERFTKGKSGYTFNGVDNDKNPIVKLIEGARGKSVSWFKDFIIPLIGKKRK